MTTLTPEEVADQLKVSVDTVARLRKRGELKCLRVGRQIRFTAADLADYLARAREPVGRRRGPALPRTASDFDTDRELAQFFGRAI